VNVILKKNRVVILEFPNISRSRQNLSSNVHVCSVIVVW